MTMLLKLYNIFLNQLLQKLLMRFVAKKIASGDLSREASRLVDSSQKILDEIKLVY